MNWRLSRSHVILVAAVSTLALAATAAGTRAVGTMAIRPHGIVLALALDGRRVAFGNGPKIVVWNLATGRQTRMGGVGDKHLVGLAIAGSHAAWLADAGGNEEADQYLYTSSLLRPKQRQVAQELRSGGQCGAGQIGYQPACAGSWLGGVVGSGNRILVNRWATNTAGAITKGGLFVLRGTRFKPVATGSDTVEAVAADSRSVAVQQWRWHPAGKAIHVYSSSGRRLSNVNPKLQPLSVDVSGRNLVVLQRDGKLALYDARTGALRRTFHLHPKVLPPHEVPPGNPGQLQALAVHGNIAVYSKPVRFVRGGTPRVSAIHALNLSTGKDRAIAQAPGQIPLARIDSAGLVYATEGEGYGPNGIVFVPYGQVAAAVS